MDIQQAVAENIRRIRKTQKMSIDQTAESAGISKSMLGQIERGLVNPTIGVLDKIAKGMHVSLEQLVENSAEDGAVLYRAVDVTGERLYGGKVIRYPLFPFDTDEGSESNQLDIFISGSYHAPQQVPGSRVFITVLSGLVEVQCGGETFTLESRDSLSFSGNGAYCYINKGNNTVRLIERVQYQK